MRIKNRKFRSKILYKADKDSDPDLQKADPIPKFNVRVKNSFLTNFSVLISNMTIIRAQKHTNKPFLFPNLSIFILEQNFAIRQIRGHWFQMQQYYFQVPAGKIPKSVVFGRKFKDFYFCTKLYNKTNSKGLSSYMKKVFSKFVAQNTQIGHLWLKL